MTIQRRTYKTVNAAADGDNTVISAPAAGQQIRVLGIVLTCATTLGMAILKSGASGTEHGRTNLAIGSSVSAYGDESVPVFECDKGAAFVINNAAGVDTLGFVTYDIE